MGGARPGGRGQTDRGGAYHEDGLVPQVGLLHRALGQRGHRAPPRQQGQQRGGARGRLELRQHLAPGPAVELGREQQPCHRGLHVLLCVLVGVEGLPQLRGYVLCGARGVSAGQHPGIRRRTARNGGLGDLGAGVQKFASGRGSRKRRGARKRQGMGSTGPGGGGRAVLGGGEATRAAAGAYWEAGGPIGPQRTVTMTR